MTGKITISRNKICLEDLALGNSTVTQARGSSSLTLSEINASNFPYDNNFSVKEKIDSFNNTVYVDENLIPQYIATPRDSIDLNLVDVIWIKEIDANENQVYYYDTLMFKYNPTTGDLIIDESLFDGAVTDLTTAYTAADTVVTNAYTAAIAAETAAREAAIAQLILDYITADEGVVASLQLGSASRLDAGTDALDVVQLDATAKLPAVDGSQLTNLPAATAPAGSIIQSILDESTALTSYSNLIPRAGSAPANTVGDEILSITITPTATNNKIQIKFQGTAHTSTVGVAPAALMFIDGIFKRGTYARAESSSTTYPLALVMETEIIAPNTNPITISIRVGPSINSGDIQFNDNSWGSTGKSATLTATEVKV